MLRCQELKSVVEQNKKPEWNSKLYVGQRMFADSKQNNN